MTLEEIDKRLDAYSRSQREERLRIGRGFGSDLTEAQANKTLNGIASYGAELAKRGFGPSHVAELAWCRDAIAVCIGGRGSAQVGMKVTSVTLWDTMKDGKASRMEIRSIISERRDELDQETDEASQTAVITIDTTLEKTSTAGADPIKLAEQLERLVKLTQSPIVAAKIAPESLPLIAEAEKVAQTLRELDAKMAIPRGTPAETQRLDLLDGRIVQLVRKARAAARATARKLGNPAIAKAFELNELYPD